MNETIEFLARHGYWLLIGAILGRQACLPIPANLVLVAAGALARSGKLNPSGAVGLSVMTFLLADLAWYEAGRQFGDRVLHFLCRLSRDPGSCVHRATSAFAIHGVRTLLFSKFVIGLDAVAVPLAGAARIPPVRFLVFDALGAMFWSMTYAALGYIFSDQLDRVAAHVVGMGTAVVLAVAAGLGFHIVRKSARWQRLVRHFKLAQIIPEQLRDKLNGGENILIADLQGRLDHAAEPMAIPEISRLKRSISIVPIRVEITSARVVMALRKKGVEHVRPLAGGLQALRDGGRGP